VFPSLNRGTGDLAALRSRMEQQWADLERDLDMTIATEQQQMRARIKELEAENARLRQRLAEAEITLAMHGLSVRCGRPSARGREELMWLTVSDVPRRNGPRS